ncbi:hypothetical protein JZ785_14405 [Alicyclobacillus curvatus]|nr:hypothetical protein JZ785_14405 [Alicyclobacillus curvatus]
MDGVIVLEPEYKIDCGTHNVSVLPVVKDLRLPLVATEYIVEVYAKDLNSPHVIVDYVDTYENGLEMAYNFVQCYEQASKMGFTLELDYFKHPSGRAIHVSEAADSNPRIVSRFHRQLIRSIPN